LFKFLFVFWPAIFQPAIVVKVAFKKAVIKFSADFIISSVGYWVCVKMAYNKNKSICAEFCNPRLHFYG
jgi:hypothetical protein